jgi:aldehyde:ferredoxin oxidoreductase
MMQGRVIFSGYRMDATPGRHTASFGPGSFAKQVVNSAGLCMIGYGFGGAPDVPQKMAGFMTAVTGQTFTPEELLQTGERIVNLRHAFNLREGINEEKWAIHPRIVGNPPLKEGPLAGVKSNLEAQDHWSMGALDWELATGKPSKKKLLSLGLNDVADEIWAPRPPAGPGPK